MKDVIERAPCTTAVAVEAAEVPALLDVVPRLLERIRPEWQAKELISRVRRLLPVDLSSACQRVLNAAIHDLRQKLIFAGVDLAREAAKQHKLPPVERAEDIEDYRIARLIDLAYRVGLLSRAEWRRLCRAYEIRRDLEHEDDEYQADIADCIYIFKASVEIVLSKDPLTLIRVTDVKEIVEAPSPVAPDGGLIEDFKQAPEPRQTEIWKFLVSIALDSSKPDLLRQNAFALIQWFEPYTKDAVKLAVAEVLQERIGRNGLDLLLARIAVTSGTMIYLKERHRKAFFNSFHEDLAKVGHRWTAYEQHGDLLRNLKEVGGFRFIPEEPRKKIMLWCMLAFVGEPGGYGTFGRNRRVFYSNTASPVIRELVKSYSQEGKPMLEVLAQLPEVVRATSDKHVAQRLQELLDVVS